MIVLDKIELLALKIIALARSGELKWDCNTCTDNGLNESRNCEGIEQDTEVYYHPLIGKLTACPFKYIPKHIYTFIDEYDYYEKYPATAPGYWDVNLRFWAGVRAYETAQMEVMEYINKNKSGNKHNTNDSAIQSLKKRFDNRK